MGAKRSGTVARAFGDEVKQRFRFLVDEEGFLGPEEDGNGFLAYHAPNLAITMVLDQRSRYARTLVDGGADGFAARTELTCLYVHAGLGPAQHVVWSAGTMHALMKALDSQVVALRKILPMLRGEGAAKLLRECHGK
ncbi:hypothetical protein [Lentzea aerocolonigenes]|uniref:hypothetical protein n=1 Tax=Lentzea aerocolonigenes TaxID=68170 RepID=UPI00068DFB8E|nr:hypothetical protein [Lentzea aerocolonigenes]MCP2250958.1 hypothetical protein [Lentzea aerocolonigenes]